MAILVGAVLAVPSFARAEAPPGGEPGPRPRGPESRSGGGNRNLDDVKTQILASDEEWKVIGPKVRKVTALRQAVEGIGRSMGRYPGGPGGGPGGPGGSSFRGPGGGGPGGPGGGPGGPPSRGPGSFGGPPTGGPPSGGPGSPGGPPMGGPSFGGPRPGAAAPGTPWGFGEPAFGSFMAFGGIPFGGPGPFGRPPRGGPGGPPGGGPGPFGERDPLAQVRADLQAALDDPKASPEDVQEKVAALRQAREKVRADLAAAQKDLLELLTDRQQAVLIGLGYLD